MGEHRKCDITLGSVTIISYCLFHILLINDEKEQGKKVWAVVESQTTFSDASEGFCGLLVLGLQVCLPLPQCTDSGVNSSPV